MTDRPKQTLEIFSGPKLFSSVALALGYDTFTVDKAPEAMPRLIADIRNLKGSQVPATPLVAWASPPDAAFNVQETDAHWDRDGSPLSPEADDAITVLRETIRLFWEIKPAWWFIENPYGPLRHFSLMAGFNRGFPTRNRVTIDHGEYGGAQGFRSDVWTNAFWWQPRNEAMSRLARRPTNTHPQQVPPQGRRLPAPVIAEMFEQLDDYLVRREGAGH